MAQNKIPFRVAYKKNDNQYNTGYGHYYPEAYNDRTLSLQGLIERVAFDQSVYSRDVVKGVVQRLTTVMVELLQSAQSVKWDGLGTFHAKVESAQSGILPAQLLAGGFDVRDFIDGIHIRFTPEDCKGEELTSRKFKDSCVLENVGVVEIEKVGTEPNIKRIRTLVPMDTWRQQNSQSPANP